MAKGDREAAINETNYQKNRYQGQIDPVIDTASGAYRTAVPKAIGDYNNIFNRFQNFSDTGGFTPEDLAGIRARAMSPIRAAYSQAEGEVGRQRSLQGGYSPNATAALVKMARERSQAGADAALNTETSIADLIRSGKLAGMSGMASMYGATPGQVSTFGNQVLNATGQSGDFGNRMVTNRVNIGQMPSDFDIGLGRLKSIGGMVGGAAMGF